MDQVRRSKSRSVSSGNKRSYLLRTNINQNRTDISRSKSRSRSKNSIPKSRSRSRSSNASYRRKNLFFGGHTAANGMLQPNDAYGGSRSRSGSRSRKKLTGKANMVKPLYNPFAPGSANINIDTQNKSLFSHRSSVIDSPPGGHSAINMIGAQPRIEPTWSMANSSQRGTPKLATKLNKP